uniref:Uncharacterized protein n=1 Tax=Vitis vinifera TaxID=29760 RepID=F6HVV6_VITVI
MAIIGLGLLLFALLIGNMQNFLQALGRRRLEMSLRRRDVEQWMSHRRLPEYLRRILCTTSKCSSHGACMYCLTTLTEKAISGLVWER